jgi:hypothetical protein
MEQDAALHLLGTAAEGLLPVGQVHSTMETLFLLGTTSKHVQPNQGIRWQSFS